MISTCLTCLEAMPAGKLAAPVSARVQVSSEWSYRRGDPAHLTEGDTLLLIVGIILLVIAIAGGTIVHPVLFALAIVAIVLFFMNR